MVMVLPWLNVVLLLCLVPPLGMASLSVYYEPSLGLSSPLHHVALLKRFFSLHSFRAESVSE